MPEHLLYLFLVQLSFNLKQGLLCSLTRLREAESCKLEHCSRRSNKAPHNCWFLQLASGVVDACCGWSAISVYCVTDCSSAGGWFFCYVGGAKRRKARCATLAGRYVTMTKDPRGARPIRSFHVSVRFFVHVDRDAPITYAGHDVGGGLVKLCPGFCPLMISKHWAPYEANAVDAMFVCIAVTRYNPLLVCRHGNA